ncbi:MAG: hypothetical protein SGBAC_003493 [Bacillariaceae sp.]
MKYIAILLAAAFSVVSAQSPPSLLEQFKAAGRYSFLVQVLEEIILKEALVGTGPITLFGPTDVALTVLGGADNAAPPDGVSPLVAFGRHIVVGAYTTEDIKAAGCLDLTSIAGFPIRVMYVKDGDDGHIMVDDSMVVEADIGDGTRIFHGIDKVLLESDVTYECSPESIVTTDAPAPSDAAVDSGASFSGISIAVSAVVVALSAIAF